MGLASSRLAVIVHEIVRKLLHEIESNVRVPAIAESRTPAITNNEVAASGKEIGILETHQRD